LLSKAKVKTSIQEALERNGITDDVTATSLYGILRGTDVAVTERYSVGGDGEAKLVERVAHPPTHTAKIKAAELVHKLKGTFEANRAIADVTRDELAELYRELQADVARPTRGRRGGGA